MAHYDIFRQNLAIKYPAYGHALWEPCTGSRYPAVAVGDVGFIREGQFHRLFNVLLSPTDPSHRLGVPEENEQLRPRVDDHIITGTLTPHNFCSTGVTLESEPGIFANEPMSGVSFLCRRKQGAVLSLPMQAKCENTVALGDFGEWMISHIDRWFNWARQLGMGINRMEDIVLVTGAHLTRSWTNVAFLEDQTDARVSFEFQVAADTSINWHVSPDHIIGAVLNHGPIGKDLPEDQCIFIRGFRVTRRLIILPRTLKGAAGPNPDAEGSDSEPEMKLVSISTVPECRDPLHLLLEYIAEGAPDCDMALVHDHDLARLDGFGDDTSRDTLQPDAVATRLRRSKPEIRDLLFHQGSLRGSVFTEDLSSECKNTNAETETIRVAMLSGSHIFEERLSLPSPTSSRLVTSSIAHDNSATSSMGQPEGLTSTGLLVDGFIAHTFTSVDAGRYLMLLLKTRHFDQKYGIVCHRGAWYITRNSNEVQGTSPGVPLQRTPLLDYSMRATHGTVVPQRRWTPVDEVDIRRHVESAVLQLPIFFVNSNGSLGFRLIDILRGRDRELHNANSFAPLGGKSTTHVRIHWPGYGYWKRQIGTRDETHARNPITLARFMKHVATSVDMYFRGCISTGSVATDPRWQIGTPGGITAEEVKIIGAIHVSAGSWLPILQLTRYV